jgi:ribonuclease/clavin/mitogillin
LTGGDAVTDDTQQPAGDRGNPYGGEYDWEDLGVAVRQWVPGTTLPPYRGTNAYWIPEADGVFIVDPGDGSDEAAAALVEGWRRLGEPRVKGVVLTHWHRDHSGGARVVHDRFGVPVYAGEAELPQLARILPDLPIEPWPLDRLVGDGQVFHAPGHTQGQINIWFPAARVLLAGDNVLGSSTSVVVPPDGHLRRYQATLQHCLALNPVLIGPGHGPVVRNAEAWLTYYLDHRVTREREILELLAAGPLTPRELAEAIYQGQPHETVVSGTWMVLGHLAALAEEGRVQVDAEGRYGLIP